MRGAPTAGAAAHERVKPAKASDRAAPPIPEGPLPGRLPPAALAKFEDISAEASELHKLLLASTDAVMDHRSEIMRQENEVRRLTRPTEGRGLDDDDREVVALRQHITHDRARMPALQARAEKNGERWSAVNGLRTGIEEWLRRSADFVIVPWSGAEPSLRKGEVLADAIERCRRRARELRADLHRIRSAPAHAKSAKAQVRHYVDGLAEQARPDVSGLIERIGPVRWPALATQPIMPAFTPDMSRQIGTFANVHDGLGLLAWLYRDDLVAALDREVDAVADDANALTDAERARREAEALADMLALEREEESFVRTARASGMSVARRPDADPRAVLGVLTTEQDR